MNEVSSASFSIGREPTVVYFGADWCVSCPAVQNAVKNLADKFSSITFNKVDVEKDGIIPDSMNVMGLPTVVLLENQKEVFRFTGSTAGNKLAEELGSRYGG